MASENVSPKLSNQIHGNLLSENGIGGSSRIIDRRPTQVNITSGALSGNVVYMFTTGSGEYLDLNKCFQVLRFTPTTTNTPSIESLADCAFQQATMHLNGILVSHSKNYTQDSTFSKRISKGYSVNSNSGELTYVDATNSSADTYTTAVAAESITGLNALFVVNDEPKYVPPGTSIQLEFTPDSNIVKKATIGNSSTTFTVSIADVFLRTSSVILASPPPKSQILKLLTINSNPSTVNSSSHRFDFYTKGNLVRVGCGLQDLTAASDVQNNFNVPHFRFTTDGIGAQAATDKLNTIQFQCDGKMYPDSVLDVTTYGLKNAYNDFLSETEQLNREGCESYTQWRYEGPIFTYKVIKGIRDNVRTVSVDLTFAATPTATAILFCVHEQLVRFSYENGIISSTEVAVV